MVINSDYENIDASHPDILGRGELQPRSEDREEKEEQSHISSNGSANFNQISQILVFTELCLASDFVGCSRERSGRPTTTTESTTAASGANNRGGCCLRQVVEGPDPPRPVWPPIILAATEGGAEVT